MTETVVTRGGQVTLAKEVREKLHISEGDKIIINVLGDVMLASRRDPKVFEKCDFLPENFEKTLDKIRSSPKERLKRFGIVG